MELQLAGKKILVVGLARSGLAVAKFAAARGAHVTANDLRGELALSAEAGELRQLGIEYVLGSHPELLFVGADLIVLSPGVPSDLAPLKAARQVGVAVIAEAEFAYRFMQGRWIGITGSNGKTTTTAIIGHLMKAVGTDAQVGGNIGTPLTSLVDASRPDGWIVAELSSFQLENIDRLRPSVSVLTNVTPDHLDRYPSYEDYVLAKEQIFRNQTSVDFAVLNANDAEVSRMFARASASSDRKFGSPRPVYFSSAGKPTQGEAAIWLESGEIVTTLAVNRESKGRAEARSETGPEAVIMAESEIPLVGLHNVENVMAAIAAVVCALGTVVVEVGQLKNAIKTFPGVEHRIEFVAEIGGVRFYNDSKATNIDSTAKSLESFAGNVVLILGGKDKGSDYTKLADLIKQKVKEIVLIGEASDKIERQLSGVRPIIRAGSMADALTKAIAASTAGDVVLLAPACASFDMFNNYEERGQVFKAEVRKRAAIA